MYILNEKQPLDEMSQFKRFGIILEVRSNDHGELGKSSDPAHAHILDNSGKEIAEVVLTVRVPKKPSEIFWYRTDNPSLKCISCSANLSPRNPSPRSETTRHFYLPQACT
jgi:hypothetical protein